VGTATWQGAAFDHNCRFILNLAWAGRLPDGVCNCTTSRPVRTASGERWSVAYGAEYRTSSGGGGGGWRRAPAPPGPAITGLTRDCAGDFQGGEQRANFTPFRYTNCNSSTSAVLGTVVQAGQYPGGARQGMDIKEGATGDGRTVRDLYTCNKTGAQVLHSRNPRVSHNPNRISCFDGTRVPGPAQPIQAGRSGEGLGQRQPASGTCRKTEPARLAPVSPAGLAGGGGERTAAELRVHSLPGPLTGRAGVFAQQRPRMPGALGMTRTPHYRFRYISRYIESMVWPEHGLTGSCDEADRLSTRSSTREGGDHVGGQVVRTAFRGPLTP